MVLTYFSGLLERPDDHHGGGDRQALQLGREEEEGEEGRGVDVSRSKGLIAPFFILNVLNEFCPISLICYFILILLGTASVEA
jgi:hypothetical protein